MITAWRVKQVTAVFGVVLLTLLVVSPWAMADDDDDARVTISEVFVHQPEADQITIYGEGFRHSPKVALGDFGYLTVLSVNNSQIIAELPPDLPDGDFFLSVQRYVRDDDDDDEDDRAAAGYDLTIGAGKVPAHEWDMTQLRFENPDGTWGDYVDLKGDTGDSGPQGIQGETGPQGEQGPPGPTGPAGPQGSKGVRGDRGLTGPPGAIGPPGPPGPQGLPGETGSMGPQGPRGNHGIQGEIGPQGPIGETGPIGPQGPPGENDGRTVKQFSWEGEVVGVSHFEHDLFTLPDNSNALIEIMAIVQETPNNSRRFLWHSWYACTREVGPNGGTDTEINIIGMLGRKDDWNPGSCQLQVRSLVDTVRVHLQLAPGSYRTGIKYKIIAKYFIP